MKDQKTIDYRFPDNDRQLPDADAEELDDIANELGDQLKIANKS